VFDSTDRSLAMARDSVALRSADLEQAKRNRLDAEEAARVKAWGARRGRPAAAVTFADLERVPVHCSSSLTGDWIALDACRPGQLPERPGDGVSCSTINVLDDFHLPAALKSYTPVRWRAVADCIRRDRALLWVLTEVTPALAAFILNEDSVKRWYSSSDGPTSGFGTLPTTSGATGQLVLVRRDVQVESVHHTSTSQTSGKRLSFVVATLPDGVTTMALCGVHLTSGQADRSDSALAVDKRRRQLEHVMRRLEGFSVGGKPCQLLVVAGDFNFKSGADEAACADLLRGFVEAAVGPGTGGTYDPANNGMAGLGTAGHGAMRLDRIYMRRRGGEVAALRHQVFATEAILGADQFEDDAVRRLLPRGLMTSDHYGVSTVYALGGAQWPRPRPLAGASGGGGWSNMTALALLPSPSARQEIDGWMRRERDPAFAKWPAHCNLLFPFVAPQLVAAFATEFRHRIVIGNLRHPVKLQFDRVASFRHKSTTTVHLRCAQSGALAGLHAAAESAATQVAGPRPSRDGRPVDAAYNPHVKLAGKLRNEVGPRIDSLLAELQQQFEELGRGRWDVDAVRSVVVLQKVGERMTVVEDVRLDRGRDASPAKQSLTVLRSVCRSVFGGRSDFALTPVGSAALTKGRGVVSDVDVVLVPPHSHRDMAVEEFAVAVRDVLGNGAGQHAVRLVGDTKVVALDLRDSHQLLPVDVMFGDTRHSRQAIQDAGALGARLDRIVATTALTRAVLVDALTEVKAWARAKMLTQRSLTLFAGMSWSIMLAVAAESLRPTPAPGVAALLAHFFSTFAAFDWRAHALSLDGAVDRRREAAVLDGRDCSNDGSVVVTPSPPYANANRGVSAAVVSAVQAEMRRALQAVQADEWSEYSRQPVVQLGGRYTAAVEVRFQLAETADLTRDVAEVEGWLRGRFVLFARHELGGRGLAVRPGSGLTVRRDGRGGATARLICGLDEALSAARAEDRERLVSHAEAQLNDRFLRWDERPARCTLRVLLTSEFE
jgi:poly(A) polymerase